MFSCILYTGRAGWGIAWYINGELIPRLTLMRGVTYTFDIFGGDDPSLSASYHPFYITNDPDGGYGQLNQLEKQVGSSYRQAARDRCRFCSKVRQK